MVVKSLIPTPPSLLLIHTSSYATKQASPLMLDLLFWKKSLRHASFQFTAYFDAL